LKANPSSQVNVDAEGDWWFRMSNKGQSEIHMMELAECMYDAMNESTPKELKAGEWHIPFGGSFDEGRLGQFVPDFSTAPSQMTNVWNDEIEKLKVKIATARCARVSYLNFEGKDDYEADLKLYDILSTSGHWSPFEHCLRAMNASEYPSYAKSYTINDYTKDSEKIGKLVEEFEKGDCYYTKRGSTCFVKEFGWCRNMRGFIQLRESLD
jgi:hypothetical protein